MTLGYTYDGGAMTHDVEPSGINIPQRADMGEISMGGIPLEDPAASLTMLGHRPFLVTESACTTQPRLFTGYVAERGIGRSLDRGMFVGADPRLHDLTIVDVNAIFGFRLISGADGNRGAETWGVRLTWLLGSDYLSGLISTSQAWIIASVLPMDAADYRQAFPSAVLADLSERITKPTNYFAFYDTSAHEVRLFFNYDTETIGNCDLRISNVVGDIDSSTTFAPDLVASLAREPDQTYSEVIVNYANGTIFRSRPSTAATYIRRGTVISRPYTGSAVTAEKQANAFLISHATEIDRITCSIQVPAVSVGLIQAGQAIEVKFSHMPGYSTFVWMRIVACSPKPTNDVVDFYDVALELVNPRPVGPPEAIYAELNWHHGGFYGCQPVSNYGDGAEIAGWENTGDAPHSGCGVPRPTTGAAEYIPYPEPGLCVYLGIRITADAIVDIESAGRFGGVSNGTSTSIKVDIRQNGTIIGTHTDTDPNPGIHYWGGVITISPTDIVVLAEDEFTVSFTCYNWAGFWFYAADPADGYAETHFVISGTGAWGGTGPGTELPKPGGTTTSDRDPTVDDDVDAGYGIGDRWINSVTGEEWVLVDDTSGAAVWLSTTAGDMIGGVTVSGVPSVGQEIVATSASAASWQTPVIPDHGTLPGLADDDHPQYLPRAEIRRGADRVVGITPTGYSTSGSGWTNLANATDGNIATQATLGAGVIGPGTYYAGFQFDLTTQRTLSLVTLRIGTGGAILASVWGYTVRVRYSDDGSSWTTLDTVTPVWVYYSSSGGGRYLTTFAHRSTTARHWEVALVATKPDVGYDAGFGVFDCQWAEDTSDQHALWSDSHRDIPTAAPTTGQVPTWNATTKAWEWGTGGGGRTFAFFGG